VCLCVRAVKEKWLELSTPNLLHTYSKAGPRMLWSEVKRSKGQGYRVMKCAAGVGMHVDMTASVSSCLCFHTEHFWANKWWWMNVAWYHCFSDSPRQHFCTCHSNRLSITKQKSSACFYDPHILLVIQTAMSKHWRKNKALTQSVTRHHSFFICGLLIMITRLRKVIWEQALLQMPNSPASHTALPHFPPKFAPSHWKIWTPI